MISCRSAILYLSCGSGHEPNYGDGLITKGIFSVSVSSVYRRGYRLELTLDDFLSIIIGSALISYLPILTESIYSEKAILGNHQTLSTPVLIRTTPPDVNQSAPKTYLPKVATVTCRAI